MCALIRLIAYFNLFDPIVILRKALLFCKKGLRRREEQPIMAAMMC